jgi:hypothetical protein
MKLDDLLNNKNNFLDRDNYEYYLNKRIIITKLFSNAILANILLDVRTILLKHLKVPLTSNNTN